MLFAFFFTPAFAIAGLVAAAGPVIIHLLNRRRYRTVQWAAMDFLREALQRNRRILQLRDLLLLALRTLCVLLFGLAMARPYFSQSEGAIDPDQPVHAVLIVDNSLSMAYAQLDGTLLDEARSKASEFIQRLPAGSRISVIPLCGSEDEFTFDPFRTKEDAQRALKRIEIADRRGTAPQAIDLALTACGQAPDVPAKRVVFIGDQQALNWPAEAGGSNLAQLPELQIVAVAADEPENAWIADFRLQDGIADVETGAQFLATVRYEGPSPRGDVQITLSIDGVAAASKIISLEPGQTSEVSFPYRFAVTTEPGQPTFVAAEVSLPPDRLPEDDRRHLMAPVVAALPVVFIDQLGEDEDPQKNQYGETFLLRRLLAPVTTRGDFGRQLIQIRHTRIDQLTRDMLADARLVVAAGVPRPDAAVPLLRQYVEQGGQLVIAAGGGFDPQAWQAAAWLDGAGILPTPLAAEPVGRLPAEAQSELRVFQLDFASLSSDYFLIENEDRQALADLYGVPVFFKTVVPQLDDALLAALKEAETRRLQLHSRAVEELQAKRAAWQTSSANEAGQRTTNSDLAGDEQRLAELSPNWLLWNAQRQEETALVDPAAEAERGLPRLLAAYTNDIPFMVERRIGRGDVVFVSSGVFTGAGGGMSGWNNLATTDAVLLFDRLFRSMLERTLPRRTLEGVDRITLPVALGDRRDRFTLTRPAGGIEPLSVDALAADRYGITVRNVARRGVYRVTAYEADRADDTAAAPHWQAAMAVNGPAEESQLLPIGETELRERLGEGDYRWVTSGEAISLEGAAVRGQDLWRWCLAAVIACLLIELAVLAWPMAKGRAA